ncbi:MAG TPA: PQQ-binding-like beta-propeller repeat protein [Caulobacteraceae bacterium]|nr:PQQ-binding-like beta-propeller repeat protein [Caulobacteraceae bacterium]
MRLALLALAAAGVVGLAGPAARADDVASQFRGGPEHLGRYPGPPAGDLSRVVWRFETGHMVAASPTVADGAVHIGSRDGFFYVLDEATGALRWRFRADAGVTSTAAVADGLAWFQSDAGTLYCLDLAGRKVRWTAKLGPDVAFPSAYPASGQADYWRSSPLLYDGRIYIGGGDGTVRAFDARSGRALWSFRTGGRVRATPATDGKRIYVGSFDGVFYALDIASGAEAWRFKTQGNPYFPVGHIQSSAAVADGKVVFGSRDFWVYALDAATGALAWKTTHENAWINASPAVADGLVCVGGADSQRLECDDLASGKPVWKTPIRNVIFASPAIVGEAIYTGSFMGGAIAFALKDGAITGYNIADGRSNSSPVVDKGVLFIGSDNGSVYAFAAKASDAPAS